MIRTDFTGCQKKICLIFLVFHFPEHVAVEGVSREIECVRKVAVHL
jgi:hypothetical protein